MASEGLEKPQIAMIIDSKSWQIARIQEGAFEQLQATEEKIPTNRSSAWRNSLSSPPVSKFPR